MNTNSFLGICKHKALENELSARIQHENLDGVMTKVPMFSFVFIRVDSRQV
jgi:hypothetical protein